MMRLLADENVSRLIVERLRVAGFYVKSIGATTAGASDNVVLAIATGEGRILMTEDRDFGEMVVRHGREFRVVLLELDRLSNAAKADRAAAIVSTIPERLAGNLVVIEPGRVASAASRNESNPGPCF